MHKNKLNESLFVGIDVHKKTHTALAANRFEEEVDSLTFNNTPQGMKSFLKWSEALSLHNSRALIFGVEGSGGNGELLTQCLVKNYTQVFEVNPLLTKSRRSYGTSWDKSDEKDAKLIIEILTRKLKQLPKLNLENHNNLYRTLDELNNFRHDLVKERTRLKNQLHRTLSLIDSDYRKRFKTTFSKRALRYWIKQERIAKINSLSKIRYEMVRDKAQRILVIQDRLKAIEKEQKEIIEQMGLAEITQFPGISTVIASLIIGETRNSHRFDGKVDKYQKYAGLVPREWSSGQSRRDIQSSFGNRKLNRAFYSMAVTQIRYDPKGQEYYEKKLQENKSKSQALRCLAHRLASKVYGFLKEHEKAYFMAQAKNT